MGKHYRPTQSGMMFYGYFHWTIPLMSRQSGFYTSEVPNRPGKYRVYKSFNRNTKVAYAEFEMVDTRELNKSENGLMIIGWTE